MHLQTIIKLCATNCKLNLLSLCIFLNLIIIIPERYYMCMIMILIACDFVKEKKLRVLLVILVSDNFPRSYGLILTGW